MKMIAAVKTDNSEGTEAIWVEEMRKAKVELEYKGLDKYIDEMLYDGNWDGCEVTLHHCLAFKEDIPWWEIEKVCAHHISQLEVDGHGVCGKDFTDG